MEAATIDERLPEGRIPDNPDAVDAIARIRLLTAPSPIMYVDARHRARVESDLQALGVEFVATPVGVSGTVEIVLT